MSESCRDLEPLFTQYVDGEAPSEAQSTVDAHLRACPPCRDRVAGERVVREALHTRRDRLRPCASEHLRRRCAAHAATAIATAGNAAAGLTRRRWIPLSLTATLLLALGWVFLFGLNDNVEALAAQLALDHMKCFQFAPDHAVMDPELAGRNWATRHGWPLHVPSNAQTERLELIGVRRCLSTEGITAHLLYRWQGQPLSVFVLNSVPPRISGVERLVEKLGQESIIWSNGRQTFIVVARAEPMELERVAKYVRRVSP
jgi:anti-sigma factor RsiW